LDEVLIHDLVAARRGRDAVPTGWAGQGKLRVPSPVAAAGHPRLAALPRALKGHVERPAHTAAFHLVGRDYRDRAAHGAGRP